MPDPHKYDKEKPKSVIC